MNANLLPFILVATTLVMSPGPDSILILRNTIAGGRKAGYMTVAGVQIGITVHALLSVIGLSALLYSSEILFRLLASVGAAYLAWIGWMMIRHADSVLAASTPYGGSKNAFGQGMLCNILNPKVLILFIALMPNFVDLNAGSQVRQLLVLSAVLLLINIPFQCTLVIAARWVSQRLQQRGAMRVIQWTLGGILIVFALALLINHAL